MTTSTSRVRRVVAVVAALAGVGTGCGAGQIAQTAEMIPTVDGAQGRVGDVTLDIVRLQFPQGGQYERGSDAHLQLVMVNSGIGDDALVEVRTDAARAFRFEPSGPADATAGATAGPSPSASPSATVSPDVTASPTEGAPEPEPDSISQIALPPGQRILAYSDEQVRVVLLDLTEPLLSGQSVPVTFSFREAGDVTIQVPVAISLTPGPRPSPDDTDAGED